MGLFDFVKDAGEKIFGGDDDKDKKVAAAEPQVRTREMALADRAKGESLTRMVAGMKLGLEDVAVKFRDGLATVTGTANSQADRERAILLVGNTRGVARVDDRISVETAEPEAQMYTVKGGDSLSKIAKQFYGDPMKYPEIFKANQPMLKDPDKIYPGQVLRIPALD
jgi:nucleoid-associated protein YgaU